MIGKRHREYPTALRFNGRGFDRNDAEFVVPVSHLRCIQRKTSIQSALADANAVDEKLKPIHSSATRHTRSRLEVNRTGNRLPRLDLSRVARKDNFQHWDRGPRLAERITHHEQLIRRSHRLVESLRKSRTAGVMHLNRCVRKLRLNGIGLDHCATRSGSACSHEFRERRLPCRGGENAAIAGEILTDRPR